MRKIYIQEVEFVAHTLAKETVAWNEPIPPFDTRFPGVLEGCLATPFGAFSRHPFYPGLTGKAAMLFYLLIKNHPFQNGNKRIAVVALLFFLLKNKKWIRVDSVEFYNFARWVAESNPKLKNETAAAIKKFIDTYLTDT
ncbi:MAG: type II toxin-antitoxin system death-on-curing family toxin [Candidatus Magasanikbacteria bacterium]|nr:type II toxin-antitoxin system death-on-curing family toxin [Candidatus Magasanikbacteria bacterium]